MSDLATDGEDLLYEITRALVNSLLPKILPHRTWHGGAARGQDARHPTTQCSEEQSPGQHHGVAHGQGDVAAQVFA